MFGEPAARDLISALAIASDKPVAPGWDGWLPGNVKSFAKKITPDAWDRKVKALCTLLVKYSPKHRLRKQQRFSQINLDSDGNPKRPNEFDINTNM